MQYFHQYGLFWRFRREGEQGRDQDFSRSLVKTHVYLNCLYLKCVGRNIKTIYLSTARQFVFEVLCLHFIDDIISDWNLTQKCLLFSFDHQGPGKSAQV